MQLAIINNGIIERIEESSILFPNTAFPALGIPAQEFLDENSAMEVIHWVQFDSTINKLLTVDPYIQDSKVYTCRLEPKTQSELDSEVFRATQVKENEVRSQRNQLLKDSDWTQVADAPVDKTAWVVYRQDLRDLTSQEGFPFNVVFPNPPL